MKWENILALIGAVGIGTGIWGFIDRITQYRLEKRKIVFNEKLKAFTILVKDILGFSLYYTGRLHELEKTVFDNLANSSKARLLILDKKIDKKIHSFFIDLDLLKHKKNKDSDTSKFNKEWERLNKEALEILELLKENLAKSL